MTTFNLFGIITVSMVSLGSPATAEIFDFSCGNVEFTLDMAQNTMSDRFLGERLVEWNYSDGILLWRSKPTEQWTGVNVRNGGFIRDEIEDPSANCIIPDAADQVLRSFNGGSGTQALKASDASYPFSREKIEVDFSSLSAKERKGIQRLLSEIFGRDIGAIDGVYGPVTGEALYEMQEGFAKRGWTIEEEEPSGAPTRYSDYLISLASYYDVMQ